ncbi:MAG: sulfite exporter TauE/SafE family protein [Desulfuromonadales bacterium]
MPEYLHLPALLLVGFVSGFLNILAGGGSLLTLPLLIFLGLPATVANGTNRVGVLWQNIFAVASFRRQGVLPLRLALMCTAPSLAGSYIGARLAVDIDEQLFQRLLAGVMIGVLVVILVDPAKRLRIEPAAFSTLRLAVLLVSFFFIGIYGGFVQAGVGFLIIPALMVHGIDLVRTNAVKILVILLFTIPALWVFIAHGRSIGRSGSPWRPATRWGDWWLRGWRCKKDTTGSRKSCP